MSHQSSNAKRFSLRSVFVAVAVVAIVFAGIRVVLMVRETAKRKATENGFRQIVLALHNSHYASGRLPYPIRRAGSSDWPFDNSHDPNAKPLYSWRFTVIPFVASYKMSPAFGQHWTAPANSRWHTVSQPYEYRNKSNLGMTRAFAITGPGTAFGDSKAEKPWSLDEIDADTILVVEIRDSGLHWMEHGDFDIRTMTRTINGPGGHGISSLHGSGVHVAFADAAVWYLDNDVPFADLAKFFTVDGAKTSDRDTILGPYRHD